MSDHRDCTNCELRDDGCSQQYRNTAGVSWMERRKHGPGWIISAIVIAELTAIAAICIWYR